MTNTAAHEVTLKPHKRGPFADPLFTPICATCGPLTPAPTDRDDARSVRGRHAAAVRDGAIA